MQSSKTDDLFGAAMNKCAKINSKAPSNGIVIGEEFFKIRPSDDKYSFILVDEYVPGIEGKYLTFSITSKDSSRKILNPFKRKPQTNNKLSLGSD